MAYLLDTNAVIALIKGYPVRVRERLREEQAAGVVITVSSMVLFELWYGVERSERRHENIERLGAFMSGHVGITSFDVDDAPIAGKLRATLEAAGTPIGAYDLLIAAQALRTQATLVTANASEFARVPELVWEDWSR